MSISGKEVREVNVIGKNYAKGRFKMLSNFLPQIFRHHFKLLNSGASIAFLCCSNITAVGCVHTGLPATSPVL